MQQVELDDKVAEIGLEIISRLKIDSLRAESTLFEAARAYAALDGRLVVYPEDICKVAPMTLRMRRSLFMVDFFEKQDTEQDELEETIRKVRGI